MPVEPDLTRQTCVIDSPVGHLRLMAVDDALTDVDWTEDVLSNAVPAGVLTDASVALLAYFDGSAQSFDVPLKPQGTTFQQAVWQRLLQIPYGQVQTYADIAADLGSNARPVANACGKNPIPIIIPCHRVVGSNGALGGFSGGFGVSTKQELLDIEGFQDGQGLPLFTSINSKTQ